jgi:hypothetical protein
MKKLLGITAAAVLLGMPVLAGCGGGADDVSSDGQTTASETTDSSEPTDSTDSTEPTEDSSSSDYCDALKGAKENLSATDFSQIDEKVYTQLTGEIAKVTAVAPSDVKDDWGKLLGVLTAMHRLLATANIDFDDLSGLSAGQIPPDADTQQLQKIAPKIQQLSANGSLQEAATNITNSAKQDCGLTLD